MEAKLLDFRWDWKEEVKKAKEDFLKRIKKEKVMDENEIKEIIIDYYKKEGYYINTEKNPHSWEGHPYDVIAGKINKYGEEEEIEIIGFEVKSDKDSFKRLREQLRSYNKYCDNVYVVVHKKNIPERLIMDGVGVIRVSETGEFFIEKLSYTKIEFSEVGSKSEIGILLKEQGLGDRYSTIQEIFKMTPKIWKKILFNRFFGVYDFEERKCIRFFPFTKKETEFIMKSQFDWQLKQLKKKTKELRTMIELLEDIAREFPDDKIPNSSIRTLDLVLKKEESL